MRKLHFLLTTACFACAGYWPGFTFAASAQFQLPPIAPVNRNDSLPPIVPVIPIDEYDPTEIKEIKRRAEELYWDRQYEQSLSLAVRVVEIQSRTIGETHPDFIDSLADVAKIHRERLDDAMALRLYERVLFLQNRNETTENIKIAATLTSLADLYQRVGELEKSLSHYEQADSLLEAALVEERKVLPSPEENAEKQPLLPPIEVDTALLVEQGRIDEAIAQYADSISSITNELIFLGSQNIRLSDYEKAWKLYQIAASLYRATSRDRALATMAGARLRGFAHLFLSHGEMNYAIAIFHHISSIEEQNISNIIWRAIRDRNLDQLRLGRNPIEWLSEQNAFSGSTGDLISSGLSINHSTNTYITLHTEKAPENDAAARLALKAIFRRKGRILEAISLSAQQLQEQFTDTDQALLDEVNDIVATTAELYAIGSSIERENYSSEQLEQIKRAVSRAEDLDKILQCRSGRLAEIAQSNSGFVSIESIQEVIPEDGVLIDFFLYDPVELKPDFQRTLPSHYVAYVLTGTGDIYGVDLGEASVINQKAAKLQLMLSERVDSREVAQQLYADLLAPVMPFIGGKKHLLISPDGQLSNVPFSALVNEQNRYLLETHQVSYFSASRDLLRLRTDLPSLGGTIIYANPDYDGLPETDKTIDEAADAVTTERAHRENLIRSADEECQIQADDHVGALRSAPVVMQPVSRSTQPQRVDGERRSRISIGSSGIVLQRGWMDDLPLPSIDLNNISFSPLLGTVEEANAILEFLPQAKLFEQRQATENALKQVRSPSILHIATHGFFSPDADLASTRNFGSRGGLVLTEEAALSAPSQDNIADYTGMMYRSGLALSGVNSAEDENGQEDGILTAMEASMLDLQGTQLVVLSACETGLGGVSERDGIHGLRRAFRIAGAESQLMSLWQVDDQGTKDLMTLYYQNLIEKRQGRSEALHNAQLTMLHSNYHDPFYWSSFIFSGDWRPIDREEL